MLTKEEEYTACHSCGAEYSDILVSEDIPFDGSEPVGVSVSMEGVIVRREPEPPVPLEIPPSVEESIAI